MLSLAAVFVLPYIAFVFFGEHMNPFSKPKILALRSRWRYGRRMGFAMSMGVICALTLKEILGLSLPFSMAGGASVVLLMGVFFTVERVRHEAQR
ncbi:MAG: hypothetical protein ACSHXK_16985 [Oceanococcus sp.]